MSLDEYRDVCARHTVGMAEFDSGRGVVIGFGARASAYDFVHWLTTDAADPSCSFSGTQLAENHKCAFVLGASCDMGDMLHTYTPWILGELLFAPGRGAIACFGPQSQTWQGANFDLCATVLKYLYDWGTPTAGYACYSAQKDVMADEVPGNAHTARSYIFYGDPAIRLKGCTLGEAPVVTVSAPNGGEFYQTPETIHITWEVGDEDPEGITCTVSINYAGGIGLWTVLDSNIRIDVNGEGSYDYRIPSGNVRYEHCRIQILAVDACGNQDSDISDGDFTIQMLTKPFEDPIPIDPTGLRAAPPREDFLAAPFPNPFNPNTSITFGLKESSRVSLVIYDVTGATIRSFYRSASLRAGEYVNVWDGRNDRGIQVASGSYFIRLSTGTFSRTERLILIK